MFLTPKQLHSIYPDVVIESKLMTGQQDHINRLGRIMDIFDSAIDKAIPGSGKTFTSCHYAKNTGRVLLVIGPKSLRIKWERAACAVQVSICYITYGQLRSERSPFVVKRGKVYEPIEGFQTTLGTQPVLLVYEECIHIKNKSLQTLASIALTRGAKEINKTIAHFVQILLLSATINDNRDKIIQTLAVMGIVDTLELYYYNRSTGFLLYHNGKSYALKQLYDCCIRIDPVTTETHSPYRDLNVQNAHRYLYNLFINVLASRISSAVDCKNPNTCQVVSYFAKVDREQSHRYMEACSTLHTLLTKKEESKKNSREERDSIMHALGTIYMSKVKSAVMIVNSYLVTYPKVKLVVSVESIPAIEELTRQLESWKPLVFIGNLDRMARHNVQTTFQTSTAHRLLIMNPQVAGHGIDLDDQVGDQPRVMVILPSFNLELNYQAGCRIWRRQTTKSSPTIIFLFGQYGIDSHNLMLERSIIRSLKQKGDVVGEIRSDSEKINMHLPSDGKEYIQP